ncbi:hypothetical protein JCGZ_22353 [Jatropha curcas]|uniref:Uncharacterized protein n=1 Tax=Jatropha curcas TaxID=180498 RepID=A0A067L5L1_JATCU|nr:hypothetical protein JCGZ_22353 [Jatropha curcas]
MGMESSVPPVFIFGDSTTDVARLIGHKRSPPPFIALLQKGVKPYFKRNVLRGANFASGGAGLLDFTGRQFGKVVTMREQVEQFAIVCNNITQVMGQSAEKVISNSLIFISIGSNDIFDYLLFNETYDMDYFITTVMQSYQTHLTVSRMPYQLVVDMDLLEHNHHVYQMSPYATTGMTTSGGIGTIQVKLVVKC